MLIMLAETSRVIAAVGRSAAAADHDRAGGVAAARGGRRRGGSGPRRRRRALLALLLLPAALSHANGEAEPSPEATAERLVLAFIPQENPEKLLGDVAVITGYLSERLGVPVTGYVTQDQAAAVEALRSGAADISFMGALPYVLARAQIGAEVILGEVYRGRPTYTGRIFVRKDSGITSLAGLRGKSIAFADPLSESGYLYPLDLFVAEGLLQRGDDPATFFGTVYFAGGYQQAMQAVANGFVDAAAASQFAELLLTPEQFGAVHWIAESDLIPSHAVIARRGLEPRLRAAFRDAMLALNEPDNRHLLAHVYGPDGYLAVDHDAYRGVEEMARAYDLIR